MTSPERGFFYNRYVIIMQKNKPQIYRLVNGKFPGYLQNFIAFLENLYS
jgi:hypothetical protein